jgi:hypothetical protein
LQLPKGLKAIIITWFSAIEYELTQHLRLGCGKFTNWQSTITGSKKRSRRKAQKLSLALTLQRTKHTVDWPPPAPAIYTILRSDNDYLLSSPGTPTMLAAPGLSFDNNAGEIEQIPSHVSGPLSISFDTWEETSVLGVRDLFPALRHYHTSIISSDEQTGFIN